jgi:hypothetical protein
MVKKVSEPIPPPRERADRPDRAKTHLIGGHFEPSVYRKFKIFIAERGMTTQGGVSFALHLFFEHCMTEGSAKRDLEDSS